MALTLTFPLKTDFLKSCQGRIINYSGTWRKLNWFITAGGVALGLPVIYIITIYISSRLVFVLLLKKGHMSSFSHMITALRARQFFYYKALDFF